MKYFVISDIHGFYDVLRESLQKAGYNSNNPDHHLIVVGDMFDRGNQSDQVLEYLYPLHQQGLATIIIGNHDTFLLDFLSGDRDNAEFNIRYNGFGKTLTSLASIQPPYKNLSELAKSIQKRYPFLQKWLASLPYYYELEDYIFVHGGIDGGMLDWKSMMSPRDYVWGREHLLPKIPGKTVVSGHTRVATIRKKTHDYHLLFLHSPQYFDILYYEGKILIDRFVEVSQELNVLILDL